MSLWSKLIKIELNELHYKWTYKGEEKPFLSGLVRNLTIQKGTLLPEEREIINDHIVITIDMLEKLPYPKNLRNTRVCWWAS